MPAVSRTQLHDQLIALITDNTTKDIVPEKHRTVQETANISAFNLVDDTTDDINEGSTNFWFTNERCDDRVAALIQPSADNDINWTYNDSSDTLTPTMRTNFATSSGTDTYTVTYAQPFVAYSTKMYIGVKFGNSNTGAATLNVDGLGAKSIKKNVSVDLSAGDLPAGQIIPLWYDGTNFQIVGGNTFIEWGDITGTPSSQTDLQNGTLQGGSFTPNNAPIALADSFRTAFEKAQGQINAIGSGYVPTTRTLTINSTTFDLSADRTWSVGTVTSVGLNIGAALSTIFTVTGSPVTTSGTFSFEPLVQLQNRVFASPDGAGGNPTFRALVAADLPASPYDSTYWKRGGNTLTADTILGGTSGNFAVQMYTNNREVLRLLSDGNARVNYFTMASAIAGASPIFSADGASAVINLDFRSKGAGTFRYDNGFGFVTAFSGVGDATRLGVGLGVTMITVPSILFDASKTPTIRDGGSRSVEIWSEGSTRLGTKFQLGTQSFGNLNPTSGNHYITRFWNETNNTFSPTTGTATLTAAEFSYTINQTGTATGNIKFVHLRPTVTQANGNLDFIDVDPAITAYSGPRMAALRSSISSAGTRWHLYLDGTARSHINGNILLGTVTVVSTDAWIKIQGQTGKAQINFIADGVVASPVNGDVWFETTNQNLFFRKTLFATPYSMNFMFSTGVTAVSATAGAAGALPATPDGYMEIEVRNVGIKKIAYYNP
jgi:hypothetical protein